MELQRTYGVQSTVYFPLIAAGSTDFQTTWTPGAGETQISIDGAAFGNSTNTPAHEGNGIWSLVLTAAELSGTSIAVTLSDGGTDIEDQAILISTQLSGTIEAAKGVLLREVDSATDTPTSTTFEALAIAPTTTEATTADLYNGRIIMFVTGALIGEQTDITDFASQNSKEYFTVTALTGAPSDGDRFVIL